MPTTRPKTPTVPGADQDRPCVLVVEDEAITRLAAAAMLAEAGYAVVEADSGPAAVRALEGRPGIRAVLTDIDMPAGIDGIRLAACVHLGWPGVAVIMTSGKVWPIPGDVPDGARFIAKPYGESEVLGALDQLLRA